MSAPMAGRNQATLAKVKSQVRRLLHEDKHRMKAKKHRDGGEGEAQVVSTGTNKAKRLDAKSGHKEPQEGIHGQQEANGSQRTALDEPREREKWRSERLPAASCAAA